GLAFDDAVGEKAPEGQDRVRLVRAVYDRFLRGHVAGRLIGDLSTNARNIVGMGEVPVTVDDEPCRRQIGANGVSSVEAEHQVRGKVGAPWPRVVEVLFRIERVVSDQAAEDPALEREPLAQWREVRNVRRAEMKEPVCAGEIRRGG